MLAQNFKTAFDLGLNDEQFEALCKTLVLLETGKLRHVEIDIQRDINNTWAETGIEPRFEGNFSLATWAANKDCGTVACIGGTAEAISEARFYGYENNRGLKELFTPFAIDCEEWHKVTTSQAATALRSYLTTGYADWAEAVA
jgi:hypothetical protein